MDETFGDADSAGSVDSPDVAAGATDSLRTDTGGGGAVEAHAATTDARRIRPRGTIKWRLPSTSQSVPPRASRLVVRAADLR